MKYIAILLFITLSFNTNIPKLIVLRNEYFVINYNILNNTPSHTEYTFTSKNKSSIIKRDSKFDKDNRIPFDKQPSNSDFINSPYDKGHLTPARDFEYSTDALNFTMLYTNIAPQISQMNRGIWKGIENYVRDLGDSYDTIRVVTGVIYDKKPKTIGNCIKVPKYFYKCIDTKNNTISFLCLNDTLESKSISKFIVSVDSIEILTKLNIFKSKFESNIKLIKK